MSDELGRLEPALVWQRFSELTRIARPPKGEEAARAHVLAWAAARDLGTSVDTAGNAVVRVPASPGRESSETVVLQSHLDMVCERDPDSPYDPREGRLHVVVDGDWVVAEGTTLGADNGIGVAAALAVADDRGVEHGPLELLFTVSEEQGLEGAKALDPALVSGRLLVNLDGTSDDAITVGCAGSAHTFVRLDLQPYELGSIGLEVHLSGARGGHSGEDIARGRANAIKALGRLLSHASWRIPVYLTSLVGGVSRNALPREAHAVVAIEANTEPAVRAAFEQGLGRLRAQFSGSDDGLAVAIERVRAAPAGDKYSTAVALDLLAALPSGVVAMSPAFPGTVETSTSVNVASTSGSVLTLASMTRSANAGALDDVLGTIEALARLSGAEIDVLRSYPPWRPDLESRLFATASAAYEREFGVEPAPRVVHGGLECAVIGEKLPGVQMISIGPEVVGPHAPGERLNVSSTQRFYRFLGALLAELSR